jgi:Fur family zinc uptake transcriptional regulator
MGVHDHKSHQNGADGEEPPVLTRNEKLVWEVLRRADEPMKAYEILDELKSSGVRAPMTVYRALTGLETKGVIHKIDGMNSFVLCTHDGPHDVQAFLRCSSCETVAEIEVEGIAAAVAPASKRAGFDLQSARLEVRGLCRSCAATA